MKNRTFAERYSEQHGVAPEGFQEAVFRRSLYPMARLLRPVLDLNPRYFATDRALVAALGLITQMRSFDAESFVYVNDPDNRGFVRRVLRLRISVGRLYLLAKGALHERSQASPRPGNEEG